MLDLIWLFTWNYYPRVSPIFYNTDYVSDFSNKKTSQLAKIKRLLYEYSLEVGVFYRFRRLLQIYLPTNFEVMSFTDSLQLFGWIFVILLFLLFFAGRKDVKIGGMLAMIIWTLLFWKFGSWQFTNILTIGWAGAYILWWGKFY